jgi:hypothetical protein
MTADELADLNGLLALEKCARARAGDSREEREIADDILAEIGAPSITRAARLRLNEMMHSRANPASHMAAIDDPDRPLSYRWRVDGPRLSGRARHVARMRALVRAAVASWPIFAAGAILAANSAPTSPQSEPSARPEPIVLCQLRPILGCWGSPDIVEAAGE